MKNINITTLFFEQDWSELGGKTVLGEPLSKIKAIASNDEPYKIERLTILTLVNAISCAEDMNLDKTYDILWTFEPANGTNKNQKQLAQSLLNVGYNKINKNDYNQINRSFSNQLYKFTLRDLKIDSINKLYVFKVFLKEPSADEWQVQSINSLFVVENIKECE